jgi:hypothetical protein
MGCNEKKDKKEHIRVVKSSDGHISIDRTGKMPGRGAYICDKEECLQKAIKTKRIERVLETKLDDDIYEKLRGVIIERQ